MPSKADSPLSAYKLYGPTLDRKEGRYKVFLVHLKNGSRTTMTVARYRMSVHLGRVLRRDEEVDHIDENKLNDDLENLQILSRSANVRKGNSRRGRAYVRLKCPCCKAEFERPKRQSHLQKGGRFTACGRKCSGRVKAEIQHRGMTLEIEKAITENVIEEFQTT